MSKTNGSSDEPFEADAAEQPQEDKQPNAVLVLREFNEQGHPNVSVVPLGDVRVTEAPLILKLAIKELDSAFGV